MKTFKSKFVLLLVLLLLIPAAAANEKFFKVIRMDRTDAIEEVLLRRPDFRHRSDVNGYRPLHFAKSSEMAHLLLAYSETDIDSKSDDDGKTALHVAAGFGYPRARSH